MLRTMLRIRLFEDRVGGLAHGLPGVPAAGFRGGAEAVVTGVCGALRPRDRVFTPGEPHRRLLAKGFDPAVIVREALGSDDSRTLGKGGWADVVDASRGVFPCGGEMWGPAVATGTALSDHRLGRPHVTAVVVPPNTPAGLFHESVRTAERWSLPVVFVVDASRCEDRRMPSVVDRRRIGDVPCRSVEGDDVVAVTRAVNEAAREARCGSGPRVVEASLTTPCTALAATGDRPVCAHDPIAAYQRRLETLHPTVRRAVATIAAQEDAAVEEAVTAVRDRLVLPDPEVAAVGLYAQGPERVAS
ncbi:thiamine pyrophosphate-dependent enzyme [Streptantibioticus parmotrematis]|uniref:thiamine pyrophosphate-dependent enzyme n=1 Tax=Streptantibioticus parmotrematis TaxID=2873249 RepID=UPI0033F9D778